MERLTEHEAIKEILQRTLKLYYTDIAVVNIISEFCNKLWTMEHKEVREIEDFDLSVQCFKSADGYDNIITRYVILG